MERWQAGLNEKARIEAEAKQAALEAAKADLESHVVERAANKEAKMGRNREQEQVCVCWGVMGMKTPYTFATP